MRYSKFFFFAIAILQSLPGFSQWYKLPDLSSQYSAFPLADGKLFAGIDHIPNPPSSSTPPFTDFGHSNNDLSSFTHNYYGSLTFATGSIEWGDSVNDSTACYNYGGYLAFTFDGFKTTKNINTVISVPGAAIISGSGCITSKLMYGTQFANSAAPYDTLYLIRQDLTNAKTVTRLPQYADPGIKMNFVNDSTGFFLVRYRNYPLTRCLIKTTDYGQSWTSVMSDPVNGAADFSFPSATTGFVLKATGDIYKTTNGGNSWSQVSSPLATTITCLKFANDTIGYAAGTNGTLWKTTNAGSSWVSRASGTNENIILLHTFGDVAYFITAQRHVYKNKALLVSVKELSSNNAQVSIFPNPAQDLLMLDLSGLKEDVKSIKLLNVTGETVYEKQISDVDKMQIHQIPVNALAAGIYFVRIQTPTALLQKKAVIVK